MNNDSSNGNGNGNHRSLFEFTENLILPDEIDQFSSKNSADQTLANLLIRNELFETEGSSDASTGYFRKRPARYEHPLWSLGWTDGRLGQPSETNEDLLLARGRLRRDRKTQTMKSELSLNEAKLPDLELQVTNVRELLRNAMSHYTNIVNDRAGRFHDFSYVLGGFYIVVAVLLFLADMPLSLKLVAKGFDLETELKNPQTGQKQLGIEELFVKTSSVFNQFWEPLALALGIALAGVVIKIFLDEFIFPEASEVRHKRVWTLSIIGIVFLLTIGVLGYFRAQTQDTLLQDQLKRTRSQQEEILRKQGLTKDQIAAQLGPFEPKTESKAKIATFILLTLTLPLVAGLCFSAGWRRIKDTHRYHALKLEIWNLERKLKAASISLHSAVSAIESAKTWLAFNEKAPDPDPETQQELNLYRHGYFRGINVPETIDHGLSLYERVQRSAQKILAKRLKERLWSDV